MQALHYQDQRISRPTRKEFENVSPSDSWSEMAFGRASVGAEGWHTKLLIIALVGGRAVLIKVRHEEGWALMNHTLC